MGQGTPGKGRLPGRTTATNAGRPTKSRHHDTHPGVPTTGMEKPGPSTKHKPTGQPVPKTPGSPPQHGAAREQATRTDAREPVPTQPRPGYSIPTRNHVASAAAPTTSGPYDTPTTQRTSGRRSRRTALGTTLGPIVTATAALATATATTSPPTTTATSSVASTKPHHSGGSRPTSGGRSSTGAAANSPQAGTY